MPIINSQIAETVDISTNGTHDVARYTSANVNIEPSIDSLSITPTTSQQTITAPSGTDGYSPITVAAVTSAIDANITAGNIKKDVSILGVTGTYEGSGGGSMPACYRAFRVNRGKLTNSITNSWVPLPAGTTDIDDYMLGGAYKDTPSNVLSGPLDLSSLTAFNGISCCNKAFSNCTGITSVDLSSLTTVNGSNACSQMFIRCTGITSVDLSALTTIGGYYACENMFNGCTGISGKLDLSSLTQISNQFSCRGMFIGCTGITSVDLSALRTVNGNYSCHSMFQNCTGISGKLDLSALTSITNSSSCEQMFSGCTGITSVDLSSLTLTRGSQAMFQGCTSLTSVDLSSLTTLASYDTEGFSNCFDGCTSLTSVDLSSLATFEQDQTLYNTFKDCTSLTSLSFPALTTSSFYYYEDEGGDEGGGYYDEETGEWYEDEGGGGGGGYQDPFEYMLEGVTGCTVHFPANLESFIGDWASVSEGFGGTDTTILFDLPETE